MMNKFGLSKAGFATVSEVNAHTPLLTPAEIALANLDFLKIIQEREKQIQKVKLNSIA